MSCYCEVLQWGATVRCYCTLHISICSLKIVHTCTAHCTLHSAHCTLHSALCTLHSALCTLHSAHCKLYTARFPHCTLHSAYCILQTEHCSLGTLLSLPQRGWEWYAGQPGSAGQDTLRTGTARQTRTLQTDTHGSAWKQPKEALATTSRRPELPIF